MAGDEEPLIPTTKPPLLNNCHLAILCIGISLIVIPIVFLSGDYMVLVNDMVKSSLAVLEGSKSYEIWRATPFPLTLKIYVWNITNPDEFMKGEKPNLQECGPYVWNEHREKKGIEFHPNYTVSYMQQRWWIWNEEASGNNSQDDVIYSINPVPLSIVWALRKSPFYLDIINYAFLSVKETAMIKTSVNVLLFEGYEDHMLHWIQENVIAENGTYHPMLPFLDLPPGISKFKRFGWFYTRNMSASYDGIFNMMTGVDDINKIGRIDLWNYTRDTKFFDPPCNHVTGSTGEYFQPGLSRDNVTFYTSDLCMSMSLFYKADVEDNGLKAYRFWGSNHTFTNGSVISKNECYCVKGTCAPTGLLNAESCKMGAPAFVSFPHYFNADPFLLDQVNGLCPDEEKHSFTMDVMPETGLPVNVNARMQINMRVRPYPGEGIQHEGKIDIMEFMPDLYLPMLWFEESVEAPHDIIKRLKVVQFFLSTPFVFISLCVTLGIGVIITAMIVVFWYRRKRQSNDQDVNEDENDNVENNEDRYPSGIFDSGASVQK